MNFENKPDAQKVPSEEWFAELYRKLPPAHVIDDSDCQGIDEEFLRRIAWSSRKPSLLDPRVVHISHCARCLGRLMELRQQRPEPRNRPSLAGLAALAALVLVGVSFLAYRFYTHRNANAIAETIDLSAASVSRGASNKEAFATLPARTVRITLILPAQSENGSYLVTVSRTRLPDQKEPFSTGTASQNGQQKLLETTLHLEQLNPGAYYLSTTHESDQPVYYYPLKIVR